VALKFYENYEAIKASNFVSGLEKSVRKWTRGDEKTGKKQPWEETKME